MCIIVKVDYKFVFRHVFSKLLSVNFTFIYCLYLMKINFSIIFTLNHLYNIEDILYVKAILQVE